jgi:hypothetical protein
LNIGLAATGRMADFRDIGHIPMLSLRVMHWELCDTSRLWTSLGTPFVVCFVQADYVMQVHRHISGKGSDDLFWIRMYRAIELDSLDVDGIGDRKQHDFQFG